MSEKTIITTLIGQHRTLQKDLDSISNLLDTSSAIDFIKITKLLQKFEEDLIWHLGLENGTYYLRLVKTMKARKQDVDKTETFIAEVKSIENAVFAFWGKYRSIKSIEENIEEFKKEFYNVSEDLNLRIRSEESVVYGYWGLF